MDFWLALNPESREQVAHELFFFLGVGLREILQAPLNGRQLFSVWNAEEFPPRLALLTGQKKPSVFLGIVEFDGFTGKQRSFANEFDRASPLEMPMTLAADGKRSIISSLLANSVQVWDPATNTVSIQYADLSYPTNAIRFQDDIVVAETGTKPPRVARIGAAHPEIRTAMAAMQMPVGLAAGANDLWASDWVAGTVVQIVKKGAAVDAAFCRGEKPKGTGRNCYGDKRKLVGC